MSCLLVGLLTVFCYLITAAIVKIAAMIFGFTFSWLVALGVFVIFVLLKMLF